ncbi:MULTISPECIES: SecDF P1 head subdomain-containing protein [unclassified Mycobacterium]|uniref:SecDF P1 head subdomain-containing protein n=1 Tax=unclassified Mycobacterium TaxID=2642494 RepID=UPI0029C853BD|nr:MULTISPECIES: hypothetical protein [unclassified Mycobacterium]
MVRGSNFGFDEAGMAFVRDGVVLAAPTIGAALDGDSLQLSGDLTAATAETMARMLRDGS